MPNLDNYLDSFGDLESLAIQAVYDEMDRVWDELGIDNRRPLSEQSEIVGRFYGHPVWVLNGLFSGLDPLSRSQREALAAWIARSGAARIADFGGGSGVLAEMICARSGAARVDVVDRYPHPFFLERHAGAQHIRYRPELDTGYDLVIAQDVLEHVDDPVGLAIGLIEATRPGGTVIFANCFYPLIKCHLPPTFYLRHQFQWLLRLSGMRGLGKIPGCEYARAYARTDRFDARRLRRLAGLGRPLGGLTNLLGRLRESLWPAREGTGR